MSSARIALLPGDGIGSEIVEQAVRVLQAIGDRFNHTFTFREAPIGGAAIDLVGVPLPHATLSLCQSSDAVLLGAVGGPQWDAVPSDIRPERGLLSIRKGLGLYANIRPVTVIEGTEDASPLKREILDGIDLVVVRELTGGIYFGEKSLTAASSTDGNVEERANDLCTYTTTEIARVIRLAATLARRRRNKVTSVDKANVLETSRLWRRVATHIMETEFPDVQYEHQLVDACAMHLVKRPSTFDVIVTENMFGDILTDEASIIAGSIGLLPSASLGAPAAHAGGYRQGLYEPIHGSAPDIAGQGVANPMGTILSAAMLLRNSLNMDTEARAVEDAVQQAIRDGYVTRDLSSKHPKSTDVVGTAVIDRIATHKSPSSASPSRKATPNTSSLQIGA